MLEVKGISTYYGKVQAINEVSIDVAAGEIVTIIGANGAGKSTLLKTIAGVLRPQHGRIIYQEYDITGKKPDKIVAAGISMIAEGRKLFSSMSVQENLDLGAFSNHGKRASSQIDLVFQLFPVLKERVRQKAGTLSGGEQQMLAVGRALMASPKMMLLDEPSMGLAPMVIREIFKVLLYLKKSGMTILLVEQDAKLALSVADRGYVLQTGTVLLHDTGKNLMDNREVQEIYFGKRRKGAAYDMES